MYDAAPAFQLDRFKNSAAETLRVVESGRTTLRRNRLMPLRHFHLTFTDLHYLIPPLKRQMVNTLSFLIRALSVGTSSELCVRSPPSDKTAKIS